MNNKYLKNIDFWQAAFAACSFVTNNSDIYSGLGDYCFTIRGCYFLYRFNNP